MFNYMFLLFTLFTFTIYMFLHTVTFRKTPTSPIPYMFKLEEGVGKAVVG